MKYICSTCKKALNIYKRLNQIISWISDLKVSFSLKFTLMYSAMYIHNSYRFQLARDVACVDTNADLIILESWINA